MNWVKRYIAWAIPLALIVAGSTYLVLDRKGYDLASPSVITAAPPKTQDSLASQPAGAPTAIEIPSVGLKLNVRHGNFDAQTGQWAINNTDAFFAHGTATPLLYGHNKPLIFESLSKLEEGNEMTLTYSGGSETQFIYSKTKLVKPDDASVLNEKNPKTVILLTCSGLFNDERRIVYFEEVL